MAGKPELSAASGVQNVVVYVSNDNFAQAYTVGQQNVEQANQLDMHNGSYPAPQPHSMAPVVASSKMYTDKQHLLKPPDYNPANGQLVNGSTSQAGYFSSGAHAVISQNGFTQPIVNNISGYQNINSALLSQNSLVKNFNSNNEVLTGERQAGPGRPDLKVREECENREGYLDSNYVTVMGAENPSQSVRCDSVRSETAESSCSSLSSTDDGVLVVQPQPNDMVVYDSSVSVRSGGVVVAVGPSGTTQTQQTISPLVATLPTQEPVTTVPFGWKRLLNNGSIVYISPSNTALSSLEQVKEYLLTPGTCKCGLECPLKYDTVFNFDPKVVGKPWTFSPDTNTGDLTKLCNHKRKILAMASLGCKPPDPCKLRKDYNIKRKKRKIGVQYSSLPVQQITAQAHRDKLVMNHQNFSKEALLNQQFHHQQIWPNQPVGTQQIPSNRVSTYQENQMNQGGQQFVHYQNHEVTENRVINGSPIVIGESIIIPQPPTSSSTSISQQNIQTQQTQSPQSSPNIHLQQHHIIASNNGQVMNMQPGNQICGGNVNHVINNNQIINNPGNITLQNQLPQQRIFVNGQPSEPSGPGRPNIQMIPVTVSANTRAEVHHRLQPQQQQTQQSPQQPFYNQNQYQIQQFDPNKNIRPSFMPSNHNQIINGLRGPPNQLLQSQVMLNQQKPPWPQNRIHQNINNHNQLPVPTPNQNIHNNTNIYERVPPLHQHTPPISVWNEEVNRKKVKLSKMKKRPYIIDQQNRIIESHAPCPNIDVRQIPGENNRGVLVNQISQQNQSAPSPSFMEDPSGYLAQQTALLNSTINRQTGANGCMGFICNSPVTSIQNQNQNMLAVSNSQTNGVPLPSNILMPQVKQGQNFNNRSNQNVNLMKPQAISQNVITSQQYNQIVMPQNVVDSSAIDQQQQQQHQQQQQQQHIHCQGCIADSAQNNQYVTKQHLQQIHKNYQQNSRPNSQPSTPSSSGTNDDPVTSSTFSEKHLSNHSSPDTRPIQGGTVSTSNVSPTDGSPSEPQPEAHTPTPPNCNPDTSQISVQVQNSNIQFSAYSQVQQMNQSRNSSSVFYQNVPQKSEGYCQHPHSSTVTVTKLNNPNTYSSGIVTTMASGRTVGCNTITSVLAGRANTATVSINSPTTVPVTSASSALPNQVTSVSSAPVISSNPITVNVSKSPLEMVQSVVSSIQVPQSQQQNIVQQLSPQQVIKHSPSQGLPPGHILVSSGGQLIMASTGNGQPTAMAPPPPKMMNQSNQGAMPPISVSPMITNVTASVTQVIPAVAQQVLGQQTVLVNALPAPFVLQPGVTMTMDGMAVGQNMQIPHLVTGNVIQQQIQIDGTDARRTSGLLSPENKKKGKKRKMSSQTVASMLHIAAQQNSGVVMSQQGFPQQIQMAHSPQGITTGPVMQALTIVPGKAGGPPQIVMNGQPMANTNHIGTQQLITNSQPTQQINLLQPVNLLNGATGMVQNFPTIQQFIVPNLGGMVMNPDGTATILQDTSNLGMQLQLQNVNGQNVLTPVQNNNMFNGSQSILAAGPAGMVIRAPSTPQNKIIQQQHSPGAQFLSPNGSQFVVNGAQFSGQLSPLVANVSPTQQVTFSTAPQQLRSNNQVQQAQQEYIQCGQMGQTLMVPCTPAASISTSNSNQQNTTFVQQNTTIVQQQTTMVSNNQQLQNFQPAQQQNQPNMARTTTLNVDQNFIISANDGNKQPVQALLLQRQSPQTSASYRQSVSTQTAVNQNAQTVTTNTFCQTSTLSAGSPPDTTTHSPLASGGQSPPTADTTTHSGSTDDGLSPAPSNYSGSCSDIVNLQARQQSCTMAMVHCISSSEPDSADLNAQNTEDWLRNQSINSNQKCEFTDISSNSGQIHISKKAGTPTHIAYAESSTMVSGLQFVTDQMKPQEAVVSSRNFERIIHKRKHSDALVVMETKQMHTSLYEDDEADEKVEPKSPHNFVIGDLVWGPAKGCPAWPGKLIEVQNDKVIVRWFGGDKNLSEVDPSTLQTLSEGLDAHHSARKKCRTSRKLNTQLENAIQEAMAELDKAENIAKDDKLEKTKNNSMKRNTGRLRGSQEVKKQTKT